MLLTHCAGLPAHLELWKLTATPAEARELVLRRVELERPPRSAAVYSDLGLILVGEILRRVMPKGEQVFDAFCRAHLFEPLGMHRSGFCPPSAVRQRTAPTEQCSWRKRLLRGEVHDENAAHLGGVATHAGLFTTGHDLARFAQMMLSGGVAPASASDGTAGARILSPASIAMAAALGGGEKAFPPVSGSNRALGFEKPTATNSAGAELASPAFASTAFGHTGFTGTSLWLLPSAAGAGVEECQAAAAASLPDGFFFILLSNRVCPRRPSGEEGPRKIHAVRRDLHNRAIQVLRKHGLLAANTQGGAASAGAS